MWREPESVTDRGELPGTKRTSAVVVRIRLSCIPLRGLEPECGARRFDGVLDDSEHIVGQRLQVDLISEVSAERAEDARRVVLAAIKAPVDEALDTGAPGIEESGDAKSGDSDGNLRVLAGDGAEDCLDGDDTEDVDADQRDGERHVDQRVIDEGVDLPQPVTKNSNRKGDGDKEKGQTDRRGNDEIEQNGANGAGQKPWIRAGHGCHRKSADKGDQAEHDPLGLLALLGG